VSAVVTTRPSRRHGAAKPPKRTRRTALMGRAPQDTRATAWSYLFLVLVIAVSAFPLYWMFVIATSTDAALAAIPPAIGSTVRSSPRW
jgi:ABC-type glycerol-3-phosphate transport system permease component